MAGWLSIHVVSAYPELRTTRQMVAASVRAAAEAGLTSPSHQALEASVQDEEPGAEQGPVGDRDD